MSSTVAAPVARSREGSPLLRFVGRRLLVVLGRNGNPATVKLLNQQLNLDRPAYQQYLDWITGLFHGDLGNSAVGMAQGASSAPIWPLISDAVVNSVILAVITALLMIPLSLGLGVLAAVLRGKWPDHLISVASLAAWLFIQTPVILTSKYDRASIARNFVLPVTCAPLAALAFEAPYCSKTVVTPRGVRVG